MTDTSLIPGLAADPFAQDDAGSGPPAAVRTRGERRLAAVNLVAIVTPLVGLIAAIVLLWGVAFDWTILLVMLAMGIVSGLGITIGFHRLCTHKSFKTPAFMRYLFAAAGSMAVQGPVISWCADHRKHHQHSDGEEDPHSPHMHPDGSWGEGLWATIRGAFHAHVGWMLWKRDSGLNRYAIDLLRDPAIVLAHRHFVYWVFAGLLIPGIAAGLITQTWTGFLLGILWGGLVRIFLVHHITWSVNSVCHLWGSRPFESHDHSRNNPIVGLLAMGEGWHNNHHAFPTSARHGLRWWQFDLSYLVILAMRAVGLASEVRVPDKQRIESKLRKRGSAPKH